VSIDAPAALWNTCRIHAAHNPFIDKKESMDLDDFGFPVISLTNSLLIQQADYSERTRGRSGSIQCGKRNGPRR
jgi:hypothetical protein